MNKRILIACPISSRDWILPYYLDHIYNIDYPKYLIDIYWVINNSKDQSLQLLKKFHKKYKQEYHSIIIDTYNNPKVPQDSRTKEIRKNYIYKHLSELRNLLLKKCVELDCDYLLSSDCDILLRTDTLNRLLSHNQHIVSSLIYNGYLYIPKDAKFDYDPIENAWRSPNILKRLSDGTYKHISNTKVKNYENNPIGTLYPCDFTGACILISKEVCDVAVYSPHNLGEDLPFCISAQNNGFSIWCDVSLYQQHIMSPKLLEFYFMGKI